MMGVRCSGRMDEDVASACIPLLSGPTRVVIYNLRPPTELVRVYFVFFNYSWYFVHQLIMMKDETNA